jgi:hypothetical protein
MYATMRTLEEFKRMPQAAQFMYVWENCYFLAERRENEATLIKLYQVGEFFVEIRFRLTLEFEIVRAFHDSVYLQPYLDQIDLPALE